ncbi:MAG: desulfoferrodoxin family protein [Gammaproteobacteria bacterium]
MNRRNFIRCSALGATTALVTPTVVLAGDADMAGGVYYTKEAPGRWSEKVGGHLPVIELSGKQIKITTPHEMKGFEHYIVKHIVLSDQYRFIAEKMFDPSNDKIPVSTFDLGDYSGRIYVLSVCNKHDTWMNSAEV